MGYFEKIILGIFGYLLKGIWNICLVTSRDMGYLGHHVNFARDPLRSYFHEPQKNEIHLFTLCFYIVFVHYFWNFDLNLANKRRRKVIIQSNGYYVQPSL